VYSSHRLVARRVLAKRLHSRPKKSSFGPDVLTAELVAANRAPEKKLSVVPSLDLVVTRLGKLPGPAIGPTFLNEFWKRRIAPAPRPPENRSEASSELRNTH